MGTLRIRAAACVVGFVLQACVTSQGSSSEAQLVPATGGAATADDVGRAACTEGRTFSIEHVFAAFELDLAAKSSTEAMYQSADLTFGENLVVPHKNAVLVHALGSGDLDGNSQGLLADDWEICDGRVRVKHGAHVEFLAGQLLFGPCVRDVHQPDCEVVAHYCTEGSLEVMKDRSRCVLRPGMAVEVKIWDLTCLPGSVLPVKRFGEPPIFQASHVTKTHDVTGYDVTDWPEPILSEYVFDESMRLVLDERAYKVSFHATSDFVPWVPLADDSWELCGAELRIKPHAHIEFGTHLSDRDLACVREQSGGQCTTATAYHAVGHFCQPGTLAQPGDSPLRCELKAGIPVDAAFFRVATPADEKGGHG